MIVVNATDIKNNFGKFLKYVTNNEEVIIEKNGKQVAKLICIEAYSANKNAEVEGTPISNSLLGFLKTNSSADLDYRKIKEEVIDGKYASTN